jgi:hypothetical protein
MAQIPEQIIGWQGVTLKVFEDWSVVGIGGDFRSGSIRIDSGGGEPHGLSGIELRWSVAKGVQTVDLLTSRIKPVLNEVQKQYRKTKIGTQPVAKPMTDRMHPERDVSVGFQWSLDRAGYGRIFHCCECERIIIVQVYGSGGSSFNRLAKLLVESIECHSCIKGYRTWGLYGLLVDVPSDFNLVSQQLMNIYIQLKFQRKNMVETLMVEQWSLANVQLKGGYLDEWYDQKSTSWTEGVVSEKEESVVHEHPALSVIGRRSELASVIVEAAKQYSHLRIPALNYRALLWECPESNKAYMIQSFTRKAEVNLVSDSAARTVCHLADNIEQGLGT